MSANRVQLPILDRIEWYRTRALEAALLAEEAISEDARRSYLAVASGWNLLADKLESDLHI